MCAGVCTTRNLIITVIVTMTPSIDPARHHHSFKGDVAKSVCRYVNSYHSTAAVTTDSATASATGLFSEPAP